MIRTDKHNLNQLGSGGRTVVEERDRLAAILRNRIGPEAARLLSVPEIQPGRAMVWKDADGADLRPLRSLPEPEQFAVREQADDLKARIEALAGRIEVEGDAGRIAAHLLRLALVTPDGYEALHAAGGAPVLVNWGLAAEGQAVPVLGSAETPDMPVAHVGAWAAGAETSDVGASAASGASIQPADRPRPSGLGVIAWLLPLMLLAGLGYAIWLLLQPMDPVVVERELPPDVLEDPVPEAEARLAALRAELEAAEELRDGLGGTCVALPQERVDTSPAPESVPSVVQNEPLREETTEARPGPAREPSVTRRPVDLPGEVPRISELPPRVAQLPAEVKPEPTLCEPGWTPTERPEVMVVIDGSGSMREGFPGASSRIDAARESVSRVVQNLHKDIKTGLVSFTDCDATTTPRKYSYPERPELLSRIRGVEPSRGTSLANSIRRAGNAAKSVGPATIVVVSDGEDTCGGDPCAAARALKGRKPLLKINVIDLSGGRSSVLQCVASSSGGRVFTPSNADQMHVEMQQATGQPDAGRCNP